MRQLLWGLIFALLIATIYQSESTQKSLFSAKALPVYWQETGLKFADFEDVLNDQLCSLDKKYFQACLNALISSGRKKNMELTWSKGHFLWKQHYNATEMTEKESLQVFDKYWTQDVHLYFSELWRQLENVPTDLDSSSLVAAAINGFLSVFQDPHTYILPLDYYNQVVADVSPQSLSLGIILAVDKNKQFFIRKTLSNSLAQEAGLLPGDTFLEVDRQSVQGISMRRMGELLKASEGATTHLVIQRGAEIRTLRILRTSRELPTVTWKIDTVRNLGVLNLHKFARKSCEKTAEALRDIQKQSVRGLLLDLRDNTGGPMDEATCIASLLLGGKNPVLKLIYTDGSQRTETIFGNKKKEFFGPIAVLVNSGTASAAEILAGILQDYNRAVIVGDRTFGKGSFQEGEIWGRNSKVVFFETKGLFYLPSGRTPQKEGIIPDLIVKDRSAGLQREEDLYWSAIESPSLDPRLGFKMKSNSSKVCPQSLYSQFETNEIDQQIVVASGVLECQDSHEWLPLGTASSTEARFVPPEVNTN